MFLYIVDQISIPFPVMRQRNDLLPHLACQLAIVWSRAEGSELTSGDVALQELLLHERMLQSTRVLGSVEGKRLGYPPYKHFRCRLLGITAG